MNPRSLVGMSMGARKRAARAQYMYATYSLADSRRFVIRLFGHTPDGLSDEYKRHAAMYRIGKKLRPCPGNGCRRGQSWCLRCDGTGVVSAKKAKARNVG